MELHEIIIKPSSGFGTSLKGDTIFGHFCWQAAHDPSLLEGGLASQIAKYHETPFSVFSSAYPRTDSRSAPHLFKRPDIPLDNFMEDKSMDKKTKIKTGKELKKQKWIKAGRDLVINIDAKNLFSDKDNKNLSHSTVTAHNSINRLTGTTGSGMFAPFETEIAFYNPETLLTVFVLINPDAAGIEQIIKGMTLTGRFGFGKDASTGAGRFDIIDTNPVQLPDYSRADALYTLAPSVPEKRIYKQKYFTPFVRFGKHGDKLAGSGNPFKNPVIMADEGAVMIPENRTGSPYIGQAVSNVSKAMPETVVQGYSPVLPVNFGGNR